MTPKLTKGERAQLERLFACAYAPKGGGMSKRIVSSEVLTNATRVCHHDLCVLERKKVLTFEEAGLFSAFFGVKGWNCKLTDAGRAVLEAP